MSTRDQFANARSLDEAFTAAGIDSDSECVKRGGPAASTLRRIRGGQLPRRDVVRRLARVLGMTESATATILEFTARGARP